MRTVLQHGWALISHRLDYKTESEVPKEVRRRLFRVAALLETSDELFADFGRAVDDIRATYARVVHEIREAPVEVVEERRGAELPLDIESLRAAWDTLPLDVIDQAADLAEFSEWQTPSEELVRSGSASCSMRPRPPGCVRSGTSSARSSGCPSTLPR